MTELKRKPTRGDFPTPWEDRPISRERWRRHREQIMTAESKLLGRRPPEWWIYERKTEPPDWYNEAEVLHDLGELREDELASLMSTWREYYDQAQAPDFACCIGANGTSARWIEGREAREALYRWAGIPRSLLARWDAAKRKGPRNNCL
jgi:hypothetical protein